jgi:hypothetical protein
MNPGSITVKLYEPDMPPEDPLATRTITGDGVGAGWDVTCWVRKLAVMREKRIAALDVLAIRTAPVEMQDN